MNAIELSIFDNLFASICEEMGVALARSAFSPNIKDRRDYSCALFDREGRLLGQACHIPVHLGAMAYALGDVLREHPLEPEDVLILNDPFKGGTHLPDITIVAPVYIDGVLLAHVANRAHHADIGGKKPGSMALAESILEEGLLIPPSLLYKGGEFQEGLMDWIKAGVRNPRERVGDLRAQLAAARIGSKRLIELCQKYGSQRVEEAFEELYDLGKKYMSSAIKAAPSGDYDFFDYLDGDGFSQDPLLVKVSLSFEEERLKVDFSGTAAPCRGNLNAPSPVTASAVLYALRCLLPKHCPSNGGLLEPLDLEIPAPSLLAAQSPSAVAAGNVETSQRVVDVVLGALSKAFPERIPAASCGSMNNIAIGGANYAYYETIAGGAGAHPEFDGASAIHTHMTNTLNTSIEILESHYPLRLHGYAIRRGSGASGLRKGGDGVSREIECLVDSEVSLLSERRRFPPYGLYGGGSGSPGRNLLIDSDGTVTELPAKTCLSLGPGQRVRIETPGGGAWGKKKG